MTFESSAEWHNTPRCDTKVKYKSQNACPTFESNWPLARVGQGRGPLSLLHFTCIIVHYSTVQSSAVQYSAVQYSALQCRAAGTQGKGCRSAICGVPVAIKCSASVLYYGAPHFPVLQCPVLKSTSQSYTIMHYTVLYYNALQYPVLQCTTPSCNTVHWELRSTVHGIGLQCTALHCSVRNYTTVYGITLHCTAFHCSSRHYTAV